MRYKYFIIDGTNLLWRSIYNNIKESIIHKKKIYSGGIEQFLYRVDSLIRQWGYQDTTLVYLLFDNPKSKLNIRKTLSDGVYKHSRLNKKADKHILSTANILVEVLKNYSDNFRVIGGKQDEDDLFFQVAIEKGLEADDLTKPVIDLIDISDINRALCISADLDWARNIQKNVDWYNYKDIYNEEFFEKKYNFKPTANKIKMWKALQGDSSDNIVNAVPNLNKEVLLHILENFSEPNKLFSELWKQEYSKHWKSKIHDAERQIRINYRLVDFVPLDMPVEDLIVKCKRNNLMLKMWYSSLDIPIDISMKTDKEIKDTFLKKRKTYPRRR